MSGRPVAALDVLQSLGSAAEEPGTVAGATEAGRHQRPNAGKAAARSHGLRLTSFSLVGVTVFVVGAAFQWLLIRAGASPDLSYASQAVFSIELSFFLNRWLTWRQRTVSLAAAAVKWNAQKLALTVPNLIGYAVLIRLGLNWLVANIAITAVFTLVNYVGADVWAFRHARRARRRPMPAWLPGPAAGTPRGRRGDQPPLQRAASPWFPTVSLVIPCKDNAATIRGTVRSVLAQDYPELNEIILVGSTGDSTWTALEGITDPRLIILEQEPVPGKRDPAVKRDKGIRNASGDVIALVDSDIVMAPDWLSRAIGLLNRQGRHGVVCGGMRSIHDTFWGRFVDRNVIAAKTPRVPAPYMVTMSNFGRRGRKPPITANAVFTRDVYLHCPFDEKWSYGYEDYEWFWRVAKAGNPILYAAGMEGAHHHRRSFRALAREYYRAADGCARFIRAHPDSPLARKRRLQAVFLPLITLSVLVACGFVLGDRDGLPAVAAVAALAMVFLAAREVIRARSLVAATYPLAGLALGAVFTTGLTQRLVAPGRHTAAAFPEPTRRRPSRRLRRRHTSWPLTAILGLQAALSLSLVWSNTAFGDEALYLWAGHLEIAHWLHGFPLPANQKSFQDYFSGAPQVYPPVGAVADRIGGLAAARGLSLCFMLGATVLLYLTALRLFDRFIALTAATLWAVSEPALRLAFATYDPLAILLICAAMWAAVQSAYARRRRGELILLSALFMALGSIVAYSYAIYIPIIIAVAIYAWIPVRGRRQALISATWLTGITALLVGTTATLLKLWPGITSEILARAAGTSGVLSVVRSAWAWSAIILSLAVGGSALAMARRHPKAPLLLVLTAAALLVPLDQARLQTGTAMDKHIAVGLWAAAIAASFAFAKVVRLPRTKAARTGVCAALLVIPAVAGWQQAWSVYHLWPNTARVMPAIEATEIHDPGNLLVERAGIGLQNVAEYATPAGHDWWRWANVSWAPTFLRKRDWQSYYARQLNTGDYGTIALFFPTSKLALPSSATRSLFNRSLYSLSSIRRTLLHAVATDPSAPGLYDMTEAIEADSAYRVTAIVPYNGSLSGEYVIWGRPTRAT